MGAFETTLTVRFGQVDYAGIMFYPRFYDNFHAAFEEMFTERLGVPYMSILTERRVGFPMVHMETDFHRAFRFGEPMRIVVDVTRVGRSSVDIRYRAHHGPADAISVEARSTVVVLDLDSFAPIAIPPDVRAVLEDLRA